MLCRFVLCIIHLSMFNVPSIVVIHPLTMPIRSTETGRRANQLCFFGIATPNRLVRSRAHSYSDTVKRRICDMRTCLPPI